MVSRWGIVSLVDMLKEAVLRTGCLDGVASDSTHVLPNVDLLPRIKRINKVKYRPVAGGPDACPRLARAADSPDPPRTRSAVRPDGCPPTSGGQPRGISALGGHHL